MYVAKPEISKVGCVRRCASQQARAGRQHAALTGSGSRRRREGDLPRQPRARRRHLTVRVRSGSSDPPQRQACRSARSPGRSRVRDREERRLAADQADRDPPAAAARAEHRADPRARRCAADAAASRPAPAARRPSWARGAAVTFSFRMTGARPPTWPSSSSAPATAPRSRPGIPSAVAGDGQQRLAGTAESAAARRQARPLLVPAHGAGTSDGADGAQRAGRATPSATPSTSTTTCSRSAAATTSAAAARASAPAASGTATRARTCSPRCGTPLVAARGGPGQVQAVPRGRRQLPGDRRGRHRATTTCTCTWPSRRRSRPATASTRASASARSATRATPAAATSTSSSGAGRAGTTAGSRSTRCRRCSLGRLVLGAQRSSSLRSFSPSGSVRSTRS